MGDAKTLAIHPAATAHQQPDRGGAVDIGVSYFLGCNPKHTHSLLFSNTGTEKRKTRNMSDIECECKSWNITAKVQSTVDYPNSEFNPSIQPVPRTTVL